MDDFRPGSGKRAYWRPWSRLGWETSRAARVFIARALVSSPEILVLDEPTAGVDVGAQNTFYGMLDRLNRERGLTVVFSTHNVGVVTQHVNKVACINQRLYFHGSHEEFCATDHLLEMAGGRAHIIDHEH